MAWELRVARNVQKSLVRIPAKDRSRILSALEEMETNPFTGDIVRLRADERSRWRRRVGRYRVFFTLHPEIQVVDIVGLKRRTSATY